ncbi:MAG TPA: DNA polymerase/3'-5' exonuclease PolX [Solirubrobacteraceae bacterium]|nr:DNA polymerase/3'-5' exonuclease PolX [Solirubrobacteraceae bacterium]
MADPTNSDIADALSELGDLYELDGAIIHRVVAYRTAAQSVRDSSRSVAELARTGRATELAGVGKTLQEKILALVDDNEIPAAVKLRAKFPAGLVEMTRLPGLGPKRARALYEALGIDSIDALRAAAEGQRLRTLKGFGPKAEENILAALAATPDGEVSPRVVLDRALAVGEPIVAALREHPASDRVELAGSARRMADSCKDLDIIATATDADALVQAFVGLPEIEGVRSSGSAGARVRTHNGLKVDLRVVAPEQFGNLLQHFTGSRAHNMALRESAVRRGLHVSEYGVLDDATGKTLECTSEEAVYAALGLAYIEPELRENRGELEAAADGGAGLPKLITEKDLRGDLHSHTVASDGKNSIEEMALAARDAGYEYLAITDHSASMGFGMDVPPKQLERQIELVHAANAELDGIELLAGSEVNVMPDGSLDYPDELLARLDWVIASVHTSFRMAEQEMTDRIVAAIEHPWVDALGHPTGRKVEARRPYPLDVGRVIEAAARTGTMLEINANPDRRDLPDVYARAASQAGVKILINSDAHRVRTFERVRRYGIATARRGWLTKADVANTLPFARFMKQRKRAKR